MKRIPLLLIVVVVMAFGAVNASATTCYACRHVFQCVVTTDYPAADACGFEDGCCYEIGTTCGAIARVSLASQYTVASVERLDQQRITTASNTIKTAQSSPQISQNR